MVNIMVEGYITLLFRDLRKQANRCPTVNLLKLRSEKSRACGAYALQCLAGNNKYYCKNICFKEKLGSFSPYFFLCPCVEFLVIVICVILVLFSETFRTVYTRQRDVTVGTKFSVW